MRYSFHPEGAGKTRQSFFFFLNHLSHLSHQTIPCNGQALKKMDMSPITDVSVRIRPGPGNTKKAIPEWLSKRGV